MRRGRDYIAVFVDIRRSKVLFGTPRKDSGLSLPLWRISAAIPAAIPPALPERCGHNFARLF